jgi:hypothetical protein
MDPPKRILDIVQGWENILSTNAKDALSKHDKMELVRRLEERLEEVVKPIRNLPDVAATTPEELVIRGLVTDVLDEAEACHRSAMPRRLPW